MSKSWQEVKALLDNPNVPPEQKQDLLEAWIDDQPEGRIADEQKEYIKNYAPSSDYDDQDENEYEGDNDEDTSADVDEAYNTANQSAKDAAGKDSSSEKDKGAVNEDKGKLDGKGEPGPEGAGTKNSDELLDLGNTSLRVYKEFAPILKERPGDLLGEVKDINFDPDVMDRFHQNRGIAFDKMLAEAGRFRTAKTTVDEMVHDIDGKLISLYGSWHGEAAQASSQWYSSTITPGAKSLITYLDGAAQHIEAAVKAIFGAVKSKVDQIQEQYTPEIAQATPDMARKVFALARGEGKDNADKVGEVAGWVDSKVGSDMNRRLDDENCELEEELQNYVVEQCRKWVRDCFNKDLKQLYVDGFVKTCNETNKQIDEHYDTLNNYLAQYESQFKNYDGPGVKDDKGSTDSGDSDTGSSDTGSSDTGSSDTGSSDTGSTQPSQSSGPAQTGPSATTQPPPNMPMPGENAQVPGSTTDPSAVTPGVPGANGMPGDEQTGAAKPQHVTVTEGDKKLDMSAGADGKMSLSVDDGKGPPKKYEIDFGDGKSLDATGAEGDHGKDKAGDDGPRGRSAEGEVEHIKADKDGKAVIHDGDTTITAQQLPDGDVKVTVDDGKGEPTSYTLDSSQDGGSDSITKDGADPSSASAARGLGRDSFSGDLFDGAGAGGGGGSAGGGGGLSPVGGDLGGGGGAGGGGAAGGGGGAAPAGVGAGPGGGPGAQFGAMNATELPNGAPAPAAAATAAAGGGGPAGGGHAGGGMGMAPMMGGMGGGAGQGGDTERGASQWRTVGELFDDDPASGALRNVRGVLGED